LIDNYYILKKKLSILLILLYSTVLFIPMNPVIHYLLHKKYYSEVLCENKDKPGMHCNGKCHLKKELKEKENNQNNPNSPVPIPNTSKEKYPVLINIFTENIILKKLSKYSMIYLFPFIKDIYIEIIVPPPEFQFSLFFL